MGTNAGNVLTLANSIIGVSVLAMPFCFKQCGIILSILMLLFSSLVSKLACYFLIKSALLEKRKNFEMLAFRVYGPTGKLMVELCIIGFMLGTCVAFFVIMGDLGPAILGPPLGFDHPSALRPSVLIGVAVFVVLPLGLLRNVDSLNTICAASILFYVCLVLKVLSEATTNILSWNWIDNVHLWRPSGILQCIPIFSMALSCQTQIFEIFDGFLSTPLERMNAVVRTAINMTTVFYISVGLFGYIAYCNQAFTGNLMMNFSPTLWSEVIKVGFVLSVAVSFPLVIFPCRASIHSLIFSKSGHGYELVGGSSHIPETRFQCITLVIVTSSLVVGLVMPNIEVVLGLVGSTIGVFICVIIPGIIFTSLSTKNTNERIVAQMLIGIGLIIMVLGTYANLSATQEVVREKHLADIRPELKLKPPIIQAAVTEIPAKLGGDFIAVEKPKIIIPESKQNKLPEVPKMKPPEVLVVKEISKDIPPPAPGPVSNLLVKQEKKESIDSSFIKKEPAVKVLTKMEADKAPPVVNPEPPPKEIPKAMPALQVAPLVLAPELREDSKLLKKVNEELILPQNLKNQPVLVMNESNSDTKIKDGQLGMAVEEVKKSFPQQSEKIANINEAVLEKSENVDKKPLDKLTMSMAQGVPLPLAVKGVKPAEERKEKQPSADINPPNAEKEKNSIAERGLLERVEVREKRDTEVEVKEEQEKEKENINEKESNTEKPVEPTEETPKVLAEQKEPAEKNDNSSVQENCPRPTDKTNSDAAITEKDNHVSNLSEQPKQQDSLIKTPARLSEPEAKLDVDPKLLSDNQVQGNNVMPKKRDLKSVNRKDDK
uniref:Putative sodium-coupled neutral amino acid transporter 10 n=1 Tax=Triatoma dimidiata TaxID=72491 RepID=A0A0V0G709_TRIDM